MGSILIVAHNNLPLTQKTIKTALAQDVSCDVLVIDNASTDGTSQWLRSKKGILVFNAYPKQISLAACWNRGIKAFFNSGATEVLVCNNDIELRSDTYRILSYNGDFTTGIGTDDRSKLSGDKDPKDLWQGRMPHPDFSCFMIRPSVVEKVGWFKEDYYPAYCEDSDYHIRMHRARINAYCVDLPFYHHAAATLKNASPADSIRIQRGAEQNRERFRRQYGCQPGTPEYENLFEV